MVHRLDTMQNELQKTSLRALELSWYGATAGLLVGMATFRPRQTPFLMMFGFGVSCGMAFAEGNLNLSQKLDKQAQEAEKGRKSQLALKQRDLL